MKKSLKCIGILVCVLFCSGCSMEYGIPNEMPIAAVMENRENSIEILQPVESTVSEEPAVLGQGQVVYEDTILTASQAELLKNYMDFYFSSLANLTFQGNASLYENTTADEADKSSIEFQIALRKMAEGADYSLLSYDYILRCVAVETEENGDISIQAREDNTQVFAQTPEIESKKINGYHWFVLTEVNGTWKIKSHMQFDALYLVLWSQNRQDELAAKYMVEMPEYLKQIQSRWKEQMEEAVPDTSDLYAERPYNRETAVAYAMQYVAERNPQWQDYEGSGGNCQNYVSQSILAGGIPMDTRGDAVWKWYSDVVSNGTGQSGRSSSWTGVDQFVQYAENNTGYGLVADTSKPFSMGEEGDIIVMGTEENWRHAVLISRPVQDENGDTIDYLVHSNTSNLENYPASLYGYPEFGLIKIVGWNET